MTDRPVVLIVDDEQPLRNALARWLASTGFATIVASTVAEAIERLSAVRVDAVVTDVRMPGADGTELVRHVTDHWPHIGIVVMSGSVQPDLSGAPSRVAFVGKPFTLEEISAAVTAVLYPQQSPDLES